MMQMVPMVSHRLSLIRGRRARFVFYSQYFFFIDRIFGLSFKTRFKGMHRKDPDPGKGRAKSKVRIVFVVISGGG